MLGEWSSFFKNLYEEGTGHDSKCPPNDSLSYCAGYKPRYEAGWVAAATLGDN
jgi:hypothetical protein